MFCASKRRNGGAKLQELQEIQIIFYAFQSATGGCNWWF